MRTTIEITDHQRARLLDLAARRGAKGFSQLVQEALDDYLRKVDARSEETRVALAMRGYLAGEEADALAEATRRIREDWR
jgi:metal-responsive CopG/Arc/MetJ family transcriptional regulator